jgi:hypothetical protein
MQIFATTREQMNTKGREFMRTIAGKVCIPTILETYGITTHVVGFLQIYLRSHVAHTASMTSELVSSVTMAQIFIDLFRQTKIKDFDAENGDCEIGT